MIQDEQKHSSARAAKKHWSQIISADEKVVFIQMTCKQCMCNFYVYMYMYIKLQYTSFAMVTNNQKFVLGSPTQQQLKICRVNSNITNQFKRIASIESLSLGTVAYRRSEQTKQWRGTALFTNNTVPLQCFVYSERRYATV